MHRFILIIAFCTFLCCPISSQPKDSDRLGMAIEYFQSGKFHEALVILQDLDKNYNLNPRFKAYLGVCYYYEWDFRKACDYLDSNLDDLKALSPHERSFYMYAAAESHFNLEEYDSAIPLYEQMLTLCYDNEKADSFYKLGFCYLFKRQYPEAKDYLTSALAYYKRYRNVEDLHARIVQITNMINGCEARIRDLERR